MDMTSNKLSKRLSVKIISIVIIILFMGEVAYQLGRSAGNC